MFVGIVAGTGALFFGSVPPLADEPVAVRSPAATPAPYEGPLGPAEDPRPEALSRVPVGTEETGSQDPGLYAAREPAPQVPESVSAKPLNVLVLGVDKRPGEGNTTGTRSDTIMVVQVVPGTGKVELLSVPRDLYVELWPGRQDRINQAYALGGVELARAVMEGLTGIPIDSYAIVDFEGFKQTIDAMGGVEVNVEDEIPPKYGIQDGPQTLNGAQALFYARYRGTAGGDLDRIEHQQRLISALRAEALQWNTVTKLPQLSALLVHSVETDVGVAEAISIGRALASNGEESRVETVQLQGTPTTLPDGDEVLIPNWEENQVLLQRFYE